MKYTKLIFDLDGTLTDSQEGITNSVRYAFEQLHVPVPDPETLKLFIGPPLALMFPKYGIREEDIDEGIRLFRVRYMDLGGKYENKVYPGIEDMLKALKEKGYRLFVGTSKLEITAKEILDYFHLSDYFEVIAGASYGHERENKTQVLHYLLSQMDSSDGALMIGDTKSDVEGAKNASLPCLGVRWGFGDEISMKEAGAIGVVSTPEELIRFVLEN